MMVLQKVQDVIPANRWDLSAACKSKIPPFGRNDKKRLILTFCEGIKNGSSGQGGRKDRVGLVLFEVRLGARHVYSQWIQCTRQLSMACWIFSSEAP